MSQCSTFVRCDDGLWYKDPVWYDTWTCHDWFICFDDDDPAEIVIAGAIGVGVAEVAANRILTAFGRPCKLIRRGSISSSNRSWSKRCFPQKDFSIKHMMLASSWFFEWETAPPKPQRPATHTLDKNVYGVMYPFGSPLPPGRSPFIIDERYNT